MTSLKIWLACENQSCLIGKDSSPSHIGKRVATLCVYLKVACAFPHWPYNMVCLGRGDDFLSGEKESSQRTGSGSSKPHSLVWSQVFLLHTDQPLKSVENTTKQIVTETHILSSLSRVFHPKKWKHSSANCMCRSLFWWTHLSAGDKVLSLYSSQALNAPDVGAKAGSLNFLPSCRFNDE